MSHILWSLSLAAALSLPSSLLASAANQPISVTLAAPEKPLKAGSELRLLATTRNTSDHNIVFVVSPGRIPEDGFRYTIKVLDEHARPAPLSAQVLEIRKLTESKKPVPGLYSSNVGRTLKPGQSFVDQINVSRFYDLSHPGTYTVWVTRHIPPDFVPQGQKLGTAFVRSNTITVTVVK